MKRTIQEKQLNLNKQTITNLNSSKAGQGIPTEENSIIVPIPPTTGSISCYMTCRHCTRNDDCSA